MEQTLLKIKLMVVQKKRHGRGITNETRTVAQLKFDEKLANPTNFYFKLLLIQ